MRAVYTIPCQRPFAKATSRAVRVAFFSPLPPARSGIADYSEALIGSLKPLVDLEIFSEPHQEFDPSRFDIALYHVGNNGYHGYVYETALRHPGVVVMHESNLHHLMADLTIKRGDRIAQLVIAPVVRPKLVEVEVLDESPRGSGGFGHTGR